MSGCGFFFHHKNYRKWKLWFLTGRLNFWLLGNCVNWCIFVIYLVSVCQIFIIKFYKPACDICYIHTLCTCLSIDRYIISQSKIYMLITNLYLPGIKNSNSFFKYCHKPLISTHNILRLIHYLKLNFYQGNINLKHDFSLHELFNISHYYYYYFHFKSINLERHDYLFFKNQHYYCKTNLKPNKMFCVLSKIT